MLNCKWHDQSLGLKKKQSDYSLEVNWKWNRKVPGTLTEPAGPKVKEAKITLTCTSNMTWSFPELKLNVLMMGSRVVVVQLFSHVQLFATPWTAAHQASLSITNSQSPPELMSNESVMPSNHLILCCPLLLLPSIFPSIKVFSSESALYIRWPKYWSFSISPSNEYSGLISFRMDWFDLLAAQQTLKSFPQSHSSKVSILHHSAFFIV